MPAVLSSLVECRKALDSYLETCLKSGTATDVYVKEADALACGTMRPCVLRLYPTNSSNTTLVTIVS